MKYAFVLVFLAICLVGCATDPVAADFAGHYVLAKGTSAPFVLDVEQSGKSAKMHFLAGRDDGSGAAPGGGGEGTLNAKGELEFPWADTFDNAGTATLRREGRLFQFSMKTTKATDPRALVFYGELTLKRTSAKPQP
jgi:hypothetical protein